MKKLIAFTAALLLTAAAPYASAADAPAPAKKAPAAKMDKLAPETAAACPKMGMGGGMGMMGGAMPPDLMKKMQEQMAAIRQTSDPSERQKLMQEHFQSMQEAMQSLRSSGMGGGMPCCCKQHCAQAGGKPGGMGNQCARGAGMGMMPQGGAMGGGMSGMMEQRMDMMQTMMENMLEHQRQMQPTK